ncbi:hypothetical protein HaLaN_17988, partial [Haematococcus lacustris]
MAVSVFDPVAVPEGPAGVEALKSHIFGQQTGDAESLRITEQAITVLTERLVKQQDAQALSELLD